MGSSEQTSLDRYLVNNGHRLLGQPTNMSTIRFQIRFGMVFTVLGVAGLPLSLIYGPEVAVAMIGPIVAGLLNWGIGIRFKNRYAQQVPARKVELSPEARDLLSQTLRQMGGWLGTWRLDLAPQNQGADWNRPPAIQNQPPVRAAKDVLGERAFDLLEGAAHECNRIQACIATGHAVIERRGPDLADASDEGMAFILQQASLLDKFPESGPAVEAGARKQIEALREIADRVEALQMREPLITDRLGSNSAVDRVLDDLRLENLARQELSGDAQDEEHNKA